VAQSLGAPGGDAPSANETVALGVGFVPNVQFAPMYVGIQQGFFADEGIDLTLDYGFENDYLTLVGTGNNDFMIGSGDQVILGRGQGLPVRYVYNWYSSYPVVLFSRSDADIAAPADMAGKRIGLPGTYGANYIALRALLEAAGLTEQDIQIESIGFTQAAAVSEGVVDAAVDYAVSGPVILAQAGISTTVVTLDDVFTMPANGLVTNDTVIAERPALVAGMARAMARAVAWTLANPDEAFAIALEFVPEAGGDNLEANRAVFDASLPFWQPVAGRTPGTTLAADWEAAAVFMARTGLAPAGVVAEELFTNQFAEEAAQ
jgi:NitT/TauT family transport system substrate-binding protein